MAYFNLDSLLIDEEENPQDKKDIAEVVKVLEDGLRPAPLLIDNAFKVIGNPAVYYAHRATGQKAVYGQRITKYEVDPVYPDRFSIEITSRCNYRCLMCPRTVLQRPEVDMDEDLFYKIIDEIAPHNISMVDLYRLGESCGHPKFTEFLDYIDALPSPLPTCLSSNGGSLTEEMLERIMNSTLHRFSISMNANDPVSYREITGGEGDFAKVRELVRRARGLRRGRKPFFGVQFIEQDRVSTTLQEFIADYIDEVDFIESSMLEEFGGQLDQNKAYVDKNYIRDDVEIVRQPCQRSLWGRFRIYSTGDVVPCICDINAEYLNMGNVKDYTISEIFNSQRWQDFREMHQGKAVEKHPLCGPCKDWIIYSEYNKKHNVVV